MNDPLRRKIFMLKQSIAKKDKELEGKDAIIAKDDEITDLKNDLESKEKEIVSLKGALESYKHDDSSSESDEPS